MDAQEMGYCKKSDRMEMNWTENSGDDDEKIIVEKRSKLCHGVAIIVGNIIGSGIFVSPVGISQNIGAVGMAFVLWIVCGVLCLCGDMVYAELGKGVNNVKQYAIVQLLYYCQRIPVLVSFLLFLQKLRNILKMADRKRELFGHVILRIIIGYLTSCAVISTYICFPETSKGAGIMLFVISSYFLNGMAGEWPWLGRSFTVVIMAALGMMLMKWMQQLLEVQEWSDNAFRNIWHGNQAQDENGLDLKSKPPDLHNKSSVLNEIGHISPHTISETQPVHITIGKDRFELTEKVNRYFMYSKDCIYKEATGGDQSLCTHSVFEDHDDHCQLEAVAVSVILNTTCCYLHQVVQNIVQRPFVFKGLDHLLGIWKSCYPIKSSYKISGSEHQPKAAICSLKQHYVDIRELYNGTTHPILFIQGLFAGLCAMLSSFVFSVGIGLVQINQMCAKIGRFVRCYTIDVFIAKMRNNVENFLHKPQLNSRFSFLSPMFVIEILTFLLENRKHIPRMISSFPEECNLNGFKNNLTCRQRPWRTFSVFEAGVQVWQDLLKLLTPSQGDAIDGQEPQFSLFSNGKKVWLDLWKLLIPSMNDVSDRVPQSKFSLLSIGGRFFPDVVKMLFSSESDIRHDGTESQVELLIFDSQKMVDLWHFIIGLIGAKIHRKVLTKVHEISLQCTSIAGKLGEVFCLACYQKWWNGKMTKTWYSFFSQVTIVWMH